MDETTTVARVDSVDDVPECAPIRDSRRPPCPVCQAPMEPEHAHHKCPSCGYIEPCCGW